jgi:glycosyltransferase involved in cell wall biosynthesis
MTDFFFHRILADPLVTVVNSGKSELWPGVVYTSLMAEDRPAHVLISLNWYLERHLRRILDVMDRARSRFPNIRFTVLACSEEDEILARSRGIDTFLCNQNCFLDERLIYPEPNVPKLYDAVYNGRLDPGKRHELAATTTRLAIITAGATVERSYAVKTLAAMRDLAYCNYRQASGVLKHLDVEHVRRILVQSWCGLALSAEEGAMYASAEYLLAGLPVVTTRSRGGRDMFFRPDYVTTVDDSPEAVAAAVLDFKQRKLDPVVIRNRTIALFREHRRQMVARLSEIAQTDLFPLADASIWLPQFKHQMRTRLKVNLGPAGA